jgi:tetratricopeptide (TPR) repeat protein
MLFLRQFNKIPQINTIKNAVNTVKTLFTFIVFNTNIVIDFWVCNLFFSLPYRGKINNGLIKVIINFRHFVFSLLIASFLLPSCRTTSGDKPQRERPERPGRERQAESTEGGLADEIRGLVGIGSLASMSQALEIIRSRELGGTEFGRTMNGIITVIIRNIYPDTLLKLPSIDLPQTSPYVRLIREAEKGNYVRPNDASTDFFEHILPFFAINDKTSPEILATALNDLEKAGQLRPDSVLPPYLRGIILEQTGQLAQADAEFKKSYAISNDFYPALANSARVTAKMGKRAEAAATLADLVISYPDSLHLKKLLAVTYYENREWSRAGSAVEEILQHEPRNGDFLLMRAHILIEQGQYTQANAPLDAYGSINPNNRTYLFLRARLQAEGNRNRDAALNYLRSIMRSNPNDEEAVIYAARLLMESQRPADQSEGRELLRRLQQTSGSSIAVLSLSLRDAVQRENWREAQSYLNRIFAVRRTVQDITDAYYVERGLGNNARALAYARELYEGNSANNEYAAIYISALIDNGRKEEATRLLENRLASLEAGVERSRLYFLRSRLQSNEEAALGDLRSSLFEDPRNLDALIAMFEVYHRRREERRAVHYLRQALAIAPDNPRLKRYESEYSALLGR